MLANDLIVVSNTKPWESVCSDEGFEQGPCLLPSASVRVSVELGESPFFTCVSTNHMGINKST